MVKTLDAPQPLAGLAVLDAEPVLVEFEPGDPENPVNWKSSKKWTIAITCVIFSFESAMMATSYNPGYASFNSKYPTDLTTFLIGNSVYFWSIAVTPLAMAPLSEIFGRNPMYLVSTFACAALFIPQALATNITTMIATRWFQGMVASVGNSMVGGTLADLFSAHERGFAMSVFSVFIFCGQAFGGMVFGYVNMILGFRWANWIQMIMGFVVWGLFVICARETRASVLLARRAKRLTKETGKIHIAPGEEERSNMTILITQSVARPVVFLFTEPIVAAISLWIGFSWGCVFLFAESIPTVFSAYHFNIGESGMVLSTTGLAGIIGVFANKFQEKLYHKSEIKHKGRAPPEARLYGAMVGGLIFPLATFGFAWTGQSKVHWIVPIIFLTIAFIGIFLLYSSVFSYLADAYEKYSSSAQAAQSLMRNILGGVFPLFSSSMYANLGSPVSSTIVASVALLLASAPIVIFLYGSRLRASSKITSELLREAMILEERERAARSRRTSMA